MHGPSYTEKCTPEMRTPVLYSLIRTLCMVPVTSLLVYIPPFMLSTEGVSSAYYRKEPTMSQY